MFRKIIIEFFLILLVVSNFVYAEDAQRMLAPRVLSKHIYAQILGEINQKQLLLSDDPEVWKPLLAFYVQEFGNQSVEFLNVFAQQIENAEKKFYILRAIEIASKPLNIYDNADDNFTKFLNDIHSATGKASIKALDIGSGDGAFLRIARSYPWAQNIKIIGIDNSASMIDNAFYLNMVNITKMDACKMDFKDKIFNVIFLNYPNPAYGQAALNKSLTEAFRVMEEGGGIVFTSCENLNNGFSIEYIVNMLLQAGFNKASIEIFKDKSIPRNYPVAGSASQVQQQNPYLIVAKKSKDEEPAAVSEFLVNAISPSNIKILKLEVEQFI